MRVISRLFAAVSLAVASLFVAGCGSDAEISKKASPSVPAVAVGEDQGVAPSKEPVTGGTPAPAPAEAGPPAGDASKAEPAKADAGAAGAGAVTLTPENTKIEFVGTHVGAKPDPRVGTFGKFTGKLELDPAAKTLKSVNVEIDAGSLTTQFDKLTDHLKSPDFLEVREYPAIKFESTKIEAGNTGTQITGKLTLHGVTKEITIPAKFDVAEGAPTLQSEFSIDRTEFGVNFAPDKVEKKVSLTVTVGGKKS